MFLLQLGHSPEVLKMWASWQDPGQLAFTLMNFPEKLNKTLKHLKYSTAIKITFQKNKSIRASFSTILKFG